MSTTSANMKKTAEEILQGFQDLRVEQRRLVTKIQELEMDLNEHKIVLSALEKVEDDRKCFKLVNGVLIERNVKEIKPTVLQNKEHIESSIKVLTEQVEKKGTEVNDYKEKYNLRFRSEIPDAQEQKPQASTPAPGVLVTKA